MKPASLGRNDMRNQRHVTTGRKPSYSGSNGGDCVEVGGGGPAVAVRDTKDRTGAALAFGPDAWRQFAAMIKDAGEA
jgi:hypothetical protein